ncbi:hypothetical protein L0152_00950 [bacterium]|nr:hypothetical protein [bacterium]
MQSNGSITLNRTEGSAIHIISAGHVIFAVTMIGLGILGLIKGQFLPIWYGVPKSLPAREVLAYLTALISLATGIGLLWQRTSLIASRVLLISFVIWMLLFRVSYIFIAPTQTGTWWSCGESAVMVAAALVLYVWFAGDRNKKRFSFLTGNKGLRIATILYGLGMIPFGIAHFTYLKFTTPLVPSYLPWHTFWAYFTGGAFIVAGVAMIIGIFGKLAASLSALQMGLFTVLVWIPIVMAGRANAFQIGEFYDSITLTAAAWVVADSYRKIR